jgi:hypothetical protein
VGVCARKPELNIEAASTASAVTNILHRPIARPPVSVRMILRAG